MIAAAGWLLSLLTLAIVGAPLLLHPSYRILTRGARVVLSGAVGAVLVCWFMVLESLASVPWNLWMLGGLGALCAGLLRFLVPEPPTGLSQPDRRVSPPRASSTRARIASLAVAVAVGAVALCTLAGKTASPDILFHWGPKAQRFASARGIDAAYFHLPFHDYMRPDYPPLVPNLYAWATLMSGQFSWEAAIWLFPILLALTGVAAGGLMALRLDDDARASGRALLLATIGSIGIASTFGGIAEMPLLFFEVSGLALLLFGGTVPCQLLAGLCLAGAPATKVEGVVVAFAAALAFAFLAQARGARLGALLRTGLPSALILDHLVRVRQPSPFIPRLRWVWPLPGDPLVTGLRGACGNRPGGLRIQRARVSASRGPSSDGPSLESPPPRRALGGHRPVRVPRLHVPAWSARSRRVDFLDRNPGAEPDPGASDSDCRQSLRGHVGGDGGTRKLKSSSTRSGAGP